MKLFVGVVILAVVFIGGYVFFLPTQPTHNDATLDAPPEMNETSERPLPGTYQVDSEESVVSWRAGKPLIPGFTHGGTISVSEGAIVVEENTASGSFTLDMNSIQVTTLGAGKVGLELALENHLKNEDFFAVEEFPTATLLIHTVTPTEIEHTYTIVGSLTIKGITEDISFPARIVRADTGLTATADFEIDRTRWGITFLSAGAVSGIAENAIGDMIELSVSLTAKSQPAE